MIWNPREVENLVEVLFWGLPSLIKGFFTKWISICIAVCSAWETTTFKPIPNKLAKNLSNRQEVQRRRVRSIRKVLAIYLNKIPILEKIWKFWFYFISIKTALTIAINLGHKQPSRVRTIYGWCRISLKIVVTNVTVYIYEYNQD